MKSLFTLIIPFLCLAYAGLSQSISINETGAAPHGSAILDVSNTKKGFLPPRMTTAQRDSIVNPANGLVIFNLTAGSLNYFFAGSWYEWKGKVTYPAGAIHCNATPTTVVEVINPATGRTWMDRNLGAGRVAISSTDSLAYGDLYQWGRRADGHQCRNSATTNILSSVDQPTHGQFIIGAKESPYDWRSPQNPDLWQGVNGVNNPCPSGYRLPSDAEIDAELASWPSRNSSGAFQSPIKMPKAGMRSRSTGALEAVGDIGFYWSSTTIGISSGYLYFDNSGANRYAFNPSQGGSVRCIKNVVIIQGSIQTLDCSMVPPAGTLTQGVAASGASSFVLYTGGNGGTHAGQTVVSTGVTGLMATLEAGTFANGADTLLYTITGTPATSGTANFALNIGGQTCTLTRTVGAISLATYPAGTVHCATTPTAVVDVLNPATGKTWMDRNLGASRKATSSTDTDAYGDLYQWGRRADGHQCRNSANVTEQSSSDQPSNSNFMLPLSLSLSDWRNPQNSNLWQGVNGVNNPCPSGYRVPTEAELDTERGSWQSQNSSGAFGSPLKLARSGRRNYFTNGSIEVFGGYYYTSTITGGRSQYLSFDDGQAQIYASDRAMGGSLRCIKESTFIQGSIINLQCNNATSTGFLSQGIAASGVSSSVPYTGGNGGSHSGQMVASTGVTGLTAIVWAGAFANGSGTLIYHISGTPASTGTASFALNIGGQTCTLTRNVSVSTAPYPAGTVHCTPTPTAVVDVLNPVTGRTWMDRNLGASRKATSNTDTAAYGDLYQWGRRADGHQCRNSQTTIVFSSVDQPAHGDFIQTTTSPNDWRIPQNNLLWQGNNGINNPCPQGYRLPTEMELNDEYRSWSIQSALGAFFSPLQLPAAGGRSDSGGGLDGGSYWTSKAGGTNASYLYFSNNIVFMNGNSRAHGYSVRCIKN